MEMIFFLDFLPLFMLLYITQVCFLVTKDLTVIVLYNIVIFVSIS